MVLQSEIRASVACVGPAALIDPANSSANAASARLHRRLAASMVFSPSRRNSVRFGRATFCCQARASKPGDCGCGCRKPPVAKTDRKSGNGFRNPNTLEDCGSPHPHALTPQEGPVRGWGCLSRASAGWSTGRRRERRPGGRMGAQELRPCACGAAPMVARSRTHDVDHAQLMRPGAPAAKVQRVAKATRGAGAQGASFRPCAAASTAGMRWAARRGARRKLSQVGALHGADAQASTRHWAGRRTVTNADAAKQRGAVAFSCH